MQEIKAVIDSNVLVSILKGSRRLSSIYTAFKEERFRLVVSVELLKELSAVLYRPRLKIGSRDIKELFRLIKIKALRIKPQNRVLNACRDPKDNFILELAAEAKADFIVTGDKDLLVLSPFCGISIITPKEFLSQLRKRG